MILLVDRQSVRFCVSDLQSEVVHKDGDGDARYINQRCWSRSGDRSPRRMASARSDRTRIRLLHIAPTIKSQKSTCVREGYENGWNTRR